MTTREHDNIDALYGLEPVFEPGAAEDLQPFVSMSCPYCGEAFDTAVDLSAGSFRYVEDCQVCCQPIELTGEVDEESGRLARRRTRFAVHSPHTRQESP